MTIHSIVIRKLLSMNAHLGRRVAAHHFKVYICGSRTFFLLSTTIDAAHMLSFVVRLQQHHLIEEAISARSAGFFISCSLISNYILIFQTSTFRGSILCGLTIVCVNAVIISATIEL